MHSWWISHGSGHRFPEWWERDAPHEVPCHSDQVRFTPVTAEPVGGRGPESRASRWTEGPQRSPDSGVWSWSEVDHRSRQRHRGPSLARRPPRDLPSSPSCSRVEHLLPVCVGPPSTFRLGPSGPSQTTPVCGLGDPPVPEFPSASSSGPTNEFTLSEFLWATSV